MRKGKRREPLSSLSPSHRSPLSLSLFFLIFSPQLSHITKRPLQRRESLSDILDEKSLELNLSPSIPSVPIHIHILTQLHIYLLDELWIANLFSGSDIPCKVHEISGGGNVGPVWYVKNTEGERVIVWSCDVHERNFSKGYFDTFGDIRELWRKVICKKNGLKRFDLHPELDKRSGKLRETGTEGQKILLLGHYPLLKCLRSKETSILFERPVSIKNNGVVGICSLNPEISKF